MAHGSAKKIVSIKRLQPWAIAVVGEQANNDYVINCIFIAIVNLCHRGLL